MTYAVTRNECERVNVYVSEKARENRFSTYDFSKFYVEQCGPTALTGGNVQL